MAAEGQDPLGFFAAYGSGSSSSDSEAEEPRGGGERAAAAGGAARAEAGGRARLPPPDELFRRVSQPPAFLYNPLNKQIDWESRVLRAPEEPPREFRAWRSSAEPPAEAPAPPEPRAPPPPARDMAIKWSDVYADNGEDAPRAPARARFLPEDERRLAEPEPAPQPCGMRRLPVTCSVLCGTREARCHDDDEDDEPASAKKRKLVPGQRTKRKKL
ncbi:UPF0690 protein C1orf52 homolog [Eudromia elegans]